ncbi:Uu.00g051480.m01.CDS01 [Anthostomella pinea]|uniref:Uu.00g051480.m01.CDS01 n=1 Tax=Anthostomella pinea TaxID=933095 RepID=A0AAI8YMV3_9PEZI|nr:Uu.00g051480.m01.CDS01 [Anthostomella pinea]
MSAGPVSSVLAAFGLVSNMLLVSKVTVFIYRAFFHPLRSYPGPLLAKLWAFSTSTTMSALFFYLSRYPKCYQRLSHEIRGAFETAANIRFGPKPANCQSLRVCIDETMRISPPVPGTMWRELQPGDGNAFVVDGHVIPPGTQRWLASETTEAERKVMRDSFAPFSIGYRDCAGKNMAYLKMSLVIAKTLWHFDFKSPNG